MIRYRLFLLISAVGVTACTSLPPAATVPPYSAKNAAHHITLDDYANYAVPDESGPTRSPSGSTNQTPAKVQTTGSPASSQSSSSGDTPQALATALEQDAKVEVTQWAAEALSERFCGWDGSVNVDFAQTCATISRYMMEPYMTPGGNDLQILQAAVRTDLDNYLLAHLLTKHVGEPDAWQWIFYGSFIDRVQTAGLQGALKWAKDVPYLQDSCKSPDTTPCAIFMMSIFMNLPSVPADAATLTCAQIKDQFSGGMTSTLWKIIACNDGEKYADWMTRLGTTFTIKNVDLNQLIASAVTFDRRYRPSALHGIGTSNDESIYADELIGFLASLEASDSFLTGDDNSPYIKLMFSISAAAASQNYREVIYRLTSSVQSADVLGESVVEGDESYRLLMIAGDIANASNTSDLSTTINSIAGPTGGYMYKTITPNLLTATALVGLDYERDRVSGGNVSTTVPARGAFAPIGFEFSRPCFHAACGVLLSLVDLGSLLSYSNNQTTSGGTVSSGPNTTFAQVASPGLYYVQGFEDSPFVWGIGWSKTPRLRVATITTGQKQDLDAYRVMIFIAVDVTIADLKEYW